MKICLKENEIKSQLLNFYSGGLNLPTFIIDDLYKEENRSIDIEFISLTKIYEKKLIVKEEEIVNFFQRKIKVHSRKLVKSLDI